MKKLISLLSALTVIFNAGITRRTSNAEDISLTDLAVSLGADTDYLNIANYKHNGYEPALQKCYEHFVENCNNYEAKGNPLLSFNEALSGGSCLGISILEILVHNNVLDPDSIQSGAATLNSVEFDDTVDEYITAYQALQSHFEMDYSVHSLSSNYTAEQQAERLCEMAQKNMLSERFFLIMICNEKIRHAVTGIGIAEGSWNYNDTVYDKCILTLDSNHKNGEGELEAFSPESCIYVNSKTLQSYIPYYESASENGLDLSCIDDDSLLNYKGRLSPSDRIETNLSDANIIMLRLLPITDYDVTITDSEGETFSLKEPVRSYTQLTGKSYFVNGESFHIKGVNKNDEMFDTKALSVKNSKYYKTFGFYDADFDLDISDERTIVDNIDSNPLRYEMTFMFNEGQYQFSPHYYWFFQGETDGRLIVQRQNEGILLSSDSLIQICIDTEDVAFDNDGKLKSVSDNPNIFSLTATNSVLISFSNENKPELFIDPDKDGNYDTPVRTGDVNCDGMIDAKDASLVLVNYAKLSGKGEDSSFADNSFLNLEKADFNGDGKITAADASAILAYYADASANEMRE